MKKKDRDIVLGTRHRPTRDGTNRKERGSIFRKKKQENEANLWLQLYANDREDSEHDTDTRKGHAGYGH